MVRLAQTVHLSCVETNTFSKLTETSLHLTHVTYEFHRVRPKMTSEPIACSAQTVRLFCFETNTISKRTETSLPLTHVPRVPSGTAKTISMPMVHSAQTVHIFCAKINTISKRNKISFHLTNVALEFHWVHPKRLLCLFHVRCKPCT